MSAPAVIKVGRTPNGYRLRVEGRGTMRESPAVFAFANRALEEKGATVVVDLSDCNYLDSTFLGCLVVLHRTHCATAPRRLSILPSDAVLRRTLVPNSLHVVFHLTDACPEVVGDDQVILPLILEPAEMGRHALEAHRRLAEIDSRNQRAFRDVVDQIERELTREPT
jgi:anti-anti-sigma regulatory factor